MAPTVNFGESPSLTTQNESVDSWYAKWNFASRVKVTSTAPDVVKLTAGSATLTGCLSATVVTCRVTSTRFTPPLSLVCTLSVPGLPSPSW